MAQGTLVVICPGSGVPFFTVHLAIVVTLPYLDIGLLTSQGDPCATCVASAHWEVQTQTACWQGLPQVWVAALARKGWHWVAGRKAELAP